jgi:hypothetical protein
MQSDVSTQSMEARTKGRCAPAANGINLANWSSLERPRRETTSGKCSPCVTDFRPHSEPGEALDVMSVAVPRETGEEVGRLKHRYIPNCDDDACGRFDD